MLLSVLKKYKLSFVYFLLFFTLVTISIISEAVWPSVGANVGDGLAFLLAVFLLFSSLFHLFLTLSGWKKIIPVIIAVTLTSLWVYNWNLNNNESDRMFCNDPESDIDKEAKAEFCKKYIN